MYSHSQLPDQAIAEARLGIQENPERIDYKIHLADMFLSSGRKIKAIETCIDIINTLPYCKSALVILYQSFAPLDKSNESTIYKSRLAEIDPYFSFIKPDTKSVDDIPDIAIMLDEKEKPSTPIDNLNHFIEESWKHTTLYDDMTFRKSKPEDWSSIIEDAVISDGIGAPITDTSYEEVILPDDDLENIQKSQKEKLASTTSKKNRLLRKFSAAQNEVSDEESIPAWVFDDSYLPKTDESEKEHTKNSNILEKSTFKEIKEQSVPDKSLSKMVSEEGLTEHVSQNKSSLDSLDLEKVSSTWTDYDSKRNNSDNNSLDDTQRLEVLPENPEELLNQAFSDIKSGKIKTGLHCINKLIEEKFKLEELATQLEEVCQQYPSEVDLWLILVKVYKRLGFKEKTLETLEKAQNNISF